MTDDTDIIERLHTQADASLGPTSYLLVEAAAEIERLRAHVLVLEAEIASTAGTVRKLYAENMAREALFTVQHDAPPTTPR